MSFLQSTPALPQYLYYPFLLITPSFAHIHFLQIPVVSAMGRAPCCAKVGLKKGPWTAEEDEKLSSYIIQHGHASWRTLPQKAGLLRCGKSCRLRWANYLRPDIKRGEFSAAEEQSIIQLHALLGNRWSAIATQLPKRTDNEIKNHWNTHLKKRLLKMGLDPATHKPITRETSSCNSARFLDSSSTYKRGSSSSVSHMAQWETARLEAEARLKKESSLRAKGLWGPVSLISPKAGSLGSEAAPSGCADGPPSYKRPEHSVLMSSKNDLDGHATPSTNQDDGDMAVSHRGLSAAEVLNTLQNWEYSLQGQAGLMWPESWRMSNKGGSVEGQELSSCSSSAVEQVCHGSPRSPLCSLDHHQLLKQFNSSPAAVSTKLSWIDSLPAMVLTSPSCGLCSNQISEDPMTEKNDLGGNRTARLTSILLDELNLESEDISSTTLNSSMVCKLTTEEFLDWDNIALEDCPKDGMMKAAESIFF